jgi:acyl-CoA thioester hydrolase
MTNIADHHLAGRLIDGGHELVQRVYFEDTDFSGVVYHARYLHFMERARSDYMRVLGIHHHELFEGTWCDEDDPDHLAFAVHKMSIEFKRPAKIDDVLTITTKTLALKGARIQLTQNIYCEGQLLISAEVHVVMVNDKGRPKRIPTRVVDAFSKKA